MEKDVTEEMQFVFMIPPGTKIMKIDAKNGRVEEFEYQKPTSVNCILIKHFYFVPKKFDQKSLEILDKKYNFMEKYNLMTEEEKDEFVFMDKSYKLLWNDEENNMYFVDFDDDIVAYNSQKYLH